MHRGRRAIAGPAQISSSQERASESGIPHAKVRFYRASVLWQLGIVGAVLGFWLVSGVSAAWLGLVLPGQFGLTLGMTIVSLLAIATSRTSGSRGVVAL